MSRKGWCRRSCKQPPPRATTQISGTERTCIGDCSHPTRKWPRTLYSQPDRRSHRLSPYYRVHFWTASYRTFHLWHPSTRNRPRPSLAKVEAPHCKLQPSRKRNRTRERIRSQRLQSRRQFQAAARNRCKIPPKTCSTSTLTARLRRRCRRLLSVVHPG